MKVLLIFLALLSSFAWSSTIHDDFHFQYWVNQLENGQLISLRKNAAAKLGPLEDLRAISYLKKAAQSDENFEVRKAAVLSLGRLGQSSAKTTLEYVQARDENPEVRKSASRALRLLARRREYVEKIKQEMSGD